MALGLGSAAAGAIGSGVAASTQAGAAEQGQNLQATEAQNALNFQEQEFQTQQQNEAPYVQAGGGAITSLSQLLNGTPGTTTNGVQEGNGGLLEPWTGQFSAPTAQQAEQTPGYQFTLGQGEQALQNSAAASGGLLTGGTLKGTTNYAEGLADTTYQQTYQNALQQYQTAYQQFQNNQSNTFNRLSGVAGTGQQATATLGNQGQAAASNVGNINLTTGAQQGQQINNAGAATASGYTGVANALTGGASNIAGALTLQQILAGQQGAGGVSGYGLNGQPLNVPNIY